MKKIVLLLSSALFITGIARSQNFILHIKNNAHLDLMYSFDIQHGMTGYLSGQIADGQSKDLYMNPGVLSGVEGYIHLYPVNQPYEKVSVYYDNPLIGTGTYTVWSSNMLVCKPTKWQILNNMGADCELNIEISNPGSSYGKPIAVALNTNGVIKGSIFWDKNNIQSPEANPYGNAFTCKVLAPTQFIESNGPFTLENTGTYNGKKGYFQGSKETGTVTYETVQAFNPNMVEIRYSITGVPTDVPLDLDIIADHLKSKWTAGPQKTKPGDEYVFVVGTFPATGKNSFIVNNGVPQLNGIDFSCDGDWLKLNNDGKITGGGNMVNRIAARRSSPVLPSSMLASKLNTGTVNASNSMMQAKTANQTNQVQTKQVQGAVQKVRIGN